MGIAAREKPRLLQIGAPEMKKAIFPTLSALKPEPSKKRKQAKGAVRNLTPSQSWDSATRRTISARKTESVHLSSTIPDELLHDKQTLIRKRNTERYLNRFLLNLLEA